MSLFHSYCIQDTEILAAAFNNHSSFDVVFFLKINYCGKRFWRNILIFQVY